MLHKILFFTPAVLSIIGCTHTQLKINTIATSRTWSDIQYQQVADNLAMLAYNPEMLPYFIVIGQGSVKVADTVALAGGLEWQPSAKAKRTLGLDLGRGATANWELRPITAPERLEWMRAAYLCALGKRAHCLVPLTELRDWYLTTEGQEKADEEQTYEEKLGELMNWYVTEQEMDLPWFEKGASPGKTADAIVVGTYGKTVVVVPKNQMKALRLLTTLILDYATLELGVETKEGRATEDFYNPNLRGTGG